VFLRRLLDFQALAQVVVRPSVANVRQEALAGRALALHVLGALMISRSFTQARVAREAQAARAQSAFENGEPDRVELELRSVNRRLLFVVREASLWLHGKAIPFGRGA
jgi:hypothetical protein